MNDFEKALQFIFDAEGGYCNDKNDHGGATNLGVIQREYDAWRKKHGKEPQSVKLITKEEAAEHYKEEFWLPGKCDRMNWPVNAVHFDACVNAGVHQAAKFLQRAIGVAADGIVGPATLAALEGCCKASSSAVIAQRIIGQRPDFYRALAAKDPTQNDFLKGWLNRVDNLTQFIA